MLAHKYESKRGDVERELGRGAQVFTQVKLNGARALAGKGGLITRNGNTWKSVPHIAAALASVFETHPELVLDGELFNDDLKHDLGGLATLIAKRTPTEEDLTQSAARVQYHIYDAQIPGTYSERHKFLSEVASGLGSAIRVVPYKSVTTAKEIDDHLSKSELEGHEGIMVRRDGGYESGRSLNLLKHKRWDTEEFTIAGVHAGKGKARGTVAALSLKALHGGLFRAAVNGGSHEWRAALTRAALIGQSATVEHKGVSKRGVPLMGRVVAIRNYE